MKINQKGVGAAGMLIVIAVLALIGFAGWYIISQNNKDTKNQSSNQQQAQATTYTDSSKTYTLKVPIDWAIREAESCCEGAAPDDTKVSRSVDFIPADKVDDNAVRVQADSGTAESKDNWKASSGSLVSHIRGHWQQQSQTPETNTVEYYKNHFKGDAEEYVDHQYLVTNNDKSVYLTFREFHDHPMSDSVWNDAKHLDDFETIVNSVSFN